jgi:hypothetical protein
VHCVVCEGGREYSSNLNFGERGEGRRERESITSGSLNSVIIWLSHGSQSQYQCTRW